jgi:hypothetical protein
LPHAGEVPRFQLAIRLVGPLLVDRLGDLPEHDPDDGHRLTGDEVVVVERSTVGVPLGQDLVLARLRPQKLDEAHRPCSRSRSLSRSSTARRCGFSSLPGAI